MIHFPLQKKKNSPETCRKAILKFAIDSLHLPVHRLSHKAGIRGFRRAEAVPETLQSFLPVLEGPSDTPKKTLGGCEEKPWADGIKDTYFFLNLGFQPFTFTVVFLLKKRKPYWLD